MSTDHAMVLLVRPPMPDFPSCAVTEETCFSDPRLPPHEKLCMAAAAGFVLSGWFDYHAQGGSAAGVPGMLIFANPNEAFCCSHKDRLGNRRLVTYFSRDLLEEVAAERGYDDIVFHRATMPPGRTPMEMFGWMRRLESQLHRDEAPYALASLALRPDDAAAAPQPVCARDQRRILTIIRYIEEFYAEPCTLEALARLVGLSRYHFLHLFKTVTGQSPNRYLVDTRLRAAADRLLTTKAPVGEIALDVGFNDLSHFNACFRAMFVSTPRQWRRAN